MLPPTLRILVVGAGIAGLAAARALRMAGYRPDVVEKLPATTVPGAGIFLPGNAARALRDLGLDGPVRPLGDVIDAQRFLDETGRELCEVDLAKLWAGVGECRALPRADLQRVLLTGIGGAVRYETGVRGIRRAGDGAATVRVRRRHRGPVRPGGGCRRTALDGPGGGRPRRTRPSGRPGRLPQRGRRRPADHRLGGRAGPARRRSW